jgi:hypothetical protein
MGVIFVDEETKRPLKEMSRQRAEDFVELTDLIAAKLELPGCVYDNGADEFYINAGFIELVNKFFISRPKMLYYSWALYATSLYEIIKNERVNWDWDDTEQPPVPFRPFHSHSFANAILGDEEEPQCSRGGAFPQIGETSI